MKKLASAAPPFAVAAPSVEIGSSTTGQNMSVRGTLGAADANPRRLLRKSADACSAATAMLGGAR